MKLLDVMAGSEVVDADVDWGSVLRGGSWTLRVIGNFEETVNQLTHLLDPELEVARKDRIGLVVRESYFETNGTLVVSFEDGVRWSVPPSAHYEAWEFVSGNARLICRIGGTVAEWPG